MARYVLLRRKKSPEPAELESIAALPGVTIVDQTVARALLIDASDESVAILRSRLKDWIIAEEVEYPRPSPSRKDLREQHD